MSQSDKYACCLEVYFETLLRGPTLTAAGTSEPHSGIMESKRSERIAFSGIWYVVYHTVDNISFAQVYKLLRLLRYILFHALG